MKGNKLQSIGLKLFGLVLLAGIFSFNAQESFSQERPSLPLLSLTGADNDYDASWYPDGRIWLPQSAGQPREFLLPVFIQNEWYPRKVQSGNPPFNDTIIYPVDPTYSFQFKIHFDSSAVRAVGLQTFGPRHVLPPNDPMFIDYAPLASDFNLDMQIERDTNYLKYLFEPIPANKVDRDKGWVIRITGSSSKPLPITSEFKVLLYVKFRVQPEFGNPNNPPTAGNTPIYIGNDTIMYNKLNISTTHPFAHMQEYLTGQQYANYATPNRTTFYADYNDGNLQATPQGYIGLAGLNNLTIYDPQQGDIPIYPGVIYLRFMDNLPDFGLTSDRAGRLPAEEDDINPGMWKLVDPITVDSGSTNPRVGSREIELYNRVSGTRLNDVYVETNAPWLKVRSIAKQGAKNPRPITAESRTGFINYIDNGILDGTQGLKDPMRNNPKGDAGRVFIEVICDPALLESQDEKTGVHVGYITFRSDFAQVNPVRLRVTFIYFRSPDEGRTASSSVQGAGVKLDIRNSAPVPESTRIIFGTGHRASMKVDTLYGEYAYDFAAAPNTFGARFYPRDENFEPYLPKLGYTGDWGLGDFAANDDANIRSSSRDIRSSFDTTESILYYCKFDAGDPSKYPVIVEWDIRDFRKFDESGTPEEGDFFLRDEVNGLLFPSIDMKTQGTKLDNNRRSFVFEDPRITSFIIEYTLPKVLRYVDENGDPIIKKGWNLLSLPVKPLNNKYDVFYPNRLGRPIFFNQNFYQDAELLKEGVGYFIKYSDLVDVQFTGTYIAEVSVDKGNAVRLYPGDGDRGGWNTIGSLSEPVNIDVMKFAPFGASDINPDYVKKHGVWGYVTNTGYKEVSEIIPGLGYWIKVDKSGYLEMEVDRKRFKSDVSSSVLDKNKIYSSSSKLVIRDNGQSEAELFINKDKNLDLSYFEMPPVPALEGLFDVRYSRGTNLENTNESMIVMQGAAYPISISGENLENEYVLTDAVTGQEFGIVGKGKNVEIKEKVSNMIKFAKVENGLNTFSVNVFPNPANDFTNIDITIPSKELVTINVYNEMGTLVYSIPAAELAAGNYVEKINTMNLTPGTYIASINAGNNNSVVKFNVVR